MAKSFECPFFDSTFVLPYCRGVQMIALLQILAATCLADSPPAKPKIQADHTAYEAITGESADEEKTVWDDFYKERHHIFGKEPVSFLKDNIEMIPRGKAFVPAMGEGRNALYLAKRGFEVDGNDISEVAVDKTLAEAKTAHVTLQTTVADLNKYNYPENHDDLIVVSLFYQKSLLPRFKKALKKGGFILFYNRVDTHDKETKTSPDDFLVKPAELKESMKDFQIKTYREYVDQGFHVVGLLARKP